MRTYADDCAVGCEKVKFSVSCTVTHMFSYFLYLHTSCDHIILWLLYCIYTCVLVSVNYSLMNAAIGCRYVWITVSVFWLVQRIDQSIAMGTDTQQNGVIGVCFIHEKTNFQLPTKLCKSVHHWHSYPWVSDISTHPPTWLGAIGTLCQALDGRKQFSGKKMNIKRKWGKKGLWGFSLHALQVTFGYAAVFTPLK